jgi:hypothetical protein
MLGSAGILPAVVQHVAGHLSVAKEDNKGDESQT